MPLDNNDDPILDPAHADDSPTTVVAGAPVREEPEAAEDKLEVSDDGNIIKRGDRQYIRKEALDEERGARQKLQGALSSIEAVMPEFEEFLSAKQAGRRSTVYRATKGNDDDSEYTEDQLDGLATVRGYYTQDNKLDRARAKQELDLISTIADGRAAKAVGPVSASTIRDRAAKNTNDALNHRFSDGEPIADQKYVRAVMESLPEGARADQDTVNIATLAAAGLEYLELRKSGGIKRGRREPTFRETGGRGSGGDTESFDALDRAAAKARGKSPEQWSKLSKQISGSGGMGAGTVLDEV